eukprot:g26914.t1
MTSATRISLLASILPPEPAALCSFKSNPQLVIKVADQSTAVVAEYEVLLLQFACDVTVTLEEAQDGHVIKGVGGGVKIVSNLKVVLFVTFRAQMLHDTVPESTLGLTDVVETTLGATDTVDQVWRIY